MIRFAFTLFAAALIAGSATADGLPGAPATVEVMPGWRMADGTHMAALHITLADGWKTYWRAPGEAGIPPEFDWSESGNLAEVRVLWPVPEVFESNGMTTLGYSQELVLPVEVVPEDGSADVMLAAGLNLGVCHDICMPMQVQVSALLLEAAAEPDRRIEIAAAQRPDNAEEAGLISARCLVEPIADGLRVTAKLDLPEVGPREVTVFETGDREIWVSEAITRRAEGMLTAVADLVPPTARPFELDTGKLRFTVLSAGRAVDIRGCERTR